VGICVDNPLTGVNLPQRRRVDGSVSLLPCLKFYSTDVPFIAMQNLKG